MYPKSAARIVYTAARKAGLAQKVSPHWMRHAHYLHARPSESSSFYLPD